MSDRMVGTIPLKAYGSPLREYSGKASSPTIVISEVRSVFLAYNAAVVPDTPHPTMTIRRTIRFGVPNRPITVSLASRPKNKELVECGGLNHAMTMIMTKATLDDLL